MSNFSVKGVARRYRGLTDGFSVADLFPSSDGASGSLRSRLERLAREEHSFEVSECERFFGLWHLFEWTAAFEQTWTHVTVRVRLDPDDGIPEATMASLRQQWEDGIENTWSGRWGCGRPGELTCPLTFDVRWVTDDEHHSVRVRQGAMPTNLSTWDTSDPPSTAAHEFGHMLGHPDEYPDSRCPERDPVGTGTVMDNTSPTVPARLVARFADNIGSSVVGI